MWFIYKEPLALISRPKLFNRTVYDVNEFTRCFWEWEKNLCCCTKNITCNKLIFCSLKYTWKAYSEWYPLTLLRHLANNHINMSLWCHLWTFFYRKRRPLFERDNACNPGVLAGTEKVVRIINLCIFFLGNLHLRMLHVQVSRS